jgi:hypothetical protein
MSILFLCNGFMADTKQVDTANSIGTENPVPVTLVWRIQGEVGEELPSEGERERNSSGARLSRLRDKARFRG